MIPTPILTVLSTFRKNGVQTLLMGGQACVFYGAAQVSKDVDLPLLAEPANIERLRLALKGLAAERIAVPPFDPALFDRGHAIHFRCQSLLRAVFFDSVDRAYWEPVRRELEAMRLDEARKKWASPQAPSEAL